MSKNKENRRYITGTILKPLDTVLPDQVKDHLINYIFKIDYREDHNIISGLIADALDELGFETYLEHHVPYTLKVFGELTKIDGRIDLFATNGSYTIACEVEGQRIPTKSLRKLIKIRNALKLIVLRAYAAKKYTMPAPIGKVPNLMVLNLYTKQIDWPELPQHRQTFKEELVEG
ncbi:hypothetical protein ES703_10015 [subsurface metagenome]